MLLSNVREQIKLNLSNKESFVTLRAFRMLVDSSIIVSKVFKIRYNEALVLRKKPLKDYYFQFLGHSFVSVWMEIKLTLLWKQLKLLRWKSLYENLIWKSTSDIGTQPDRERVDLTQFVQMIRAASVSKAFFQNWWTLFLKMRSNEMYLGRT